MNKLLSALLLAVLIGCAGEQTAEPSAGEESSSTVGSTVEANPLMTASFTGGEEVTIEVPGMSCQVACFPKVKKALESVEGIASAELVPQEDDVAINDHRIVVKFNSDVAGKDALAAVTGAGYDEVNLQ